MKDFLIIRTGQPLSSRLETELPGLLVFRRQEGRSRDSCCVEGEGIPALNSDSIITCIKLD